MAARLSPLGAFIASTACVVLAGNGYTTHGQSPTGLSNIETAIVEKDGTVVVRYDLTGTGNPSDLFRISVLVSTDGGANYSITPRLVSGDVGPGVRVGAGKRIVWNVRDDVKRLQSDVVVFRINGDLESPPEYVDPPELRETPTVFELRHRHNGVLTSADSMHPIRFEVTSRTLSVAPLPNPQSSGGLTTVCEIKPSVVPIESASAEMVMLKKGFFTTNAGGGEGGRFLKVMIAEAGNDSKTATLHLAAGNSSTAGDPLLAFLGRVSVSKRRRLPGGDPSVTPSELLKNTAVALGGIENLQAIRDVIFTATLRFFQNGTTLSGIASMEMAGPGRFRRETVVNGQTVLVASDGTEVWRQESGKEPKRADDVQAKYSMLVETHFDGLRLTEWGKSAGIKGQLNVGNRVAWRLERALPDGSRVWADIDAETALPVRYGLASKGLPLIESELFDYIQYGGVREARRRVEYVNGVPAAEVLIRSAQFNTGIPPRRFKLSR